MIKESYLVMFALSLSKECEDHEKCEDCIFYDKWDIYNVDLCLFQFEKPHRWFDYLERKYNNDSTDN